MPLTAIDEEPIGSADIHFAMMNQDGRRIVCRVSEEALEDVEGTNNPSPEIRRECFDRYFAVICQIASDAYDKGDQSPLVGSAEMCDAVRKLRRG